MKITNVEEINPELGDFKSVDLFAYVTVTTGRWFWKREERRVIRFYGEWVWVDSGEVLSSEDRRTVDQLRFSKKCKERLQTIIDAKQT